MNGTPITPSAALLAGTAPVLPLANGKRYRAFSHYLRETFGGPVWRVPVDAGFSCPNRDGNVAWGGCTFCDAAGSGSPVIQSQLEVRAQIRDGMARARARRGVERFMVYFQAFTNTYARPEVLQPLYDEALADPAIVALAIGTRPDCVPNATLDLIQSYTDRLTVWVEYGLQTANDATLAAVNRGHGVAAFVDAVERTAGRGIHVAAHALFGLPGETLEDARRTASLMASLPLDGVKIHSLFIVEGAPMAKAWRRGEIELWPADRYVTAVADALEMLPPYAVIQRLTGEAPHDLHLAPDWTRDKAALVAAIDAELERRGTVQGSRWRG